MNQGCKPVNSTNVFTTRKETLILQNYHLRKWPIVITGENDPPFLLPTPPHLLPSVPMSAEACWRPKIPNDVTSNVLPVYRSAYECRRQGGQGRYSTDLPKGNQKKEQYYTTKCISSISCIRQDVANRFVHHFLSEGWTGKGLHSGTIPWNVYNVLMAICDYLQENNNISPNHHTK